MKLKKSVSGYSRKAAAYADEEISQSAMEEVFFQLSNKHHIEGWTYEYLKSISLNALLASLGIDDDNKYKDYKFDGGIIILRNNSNPKQIKIVLTCEDKSQQAKANAIERLANQLWVLHTYTDSSILPEVVFFSGNATKFDENGNIENSTIRGTIKGFISPSLKISENGHISKDRWNMIYLKEGRFTKEEKVNILLEAANKSISYWKAVV